MERSRGVGIRARAPRSLQRALRPGLPLDRLRALHPSGRRRRGRARGTLVVGARRASRMRHSSQKQGQTTFFWFRERCVTAAAEKTWSVPVFRDHLDWLESEAIYILREV